MEMTKRVKSNKKLTDFYQSVFLALQGTQKAMDDRITSTKVLAIQDYRESVRVSREAKYAY